MQRVGLGSIKGAKPSRTRLAPLQVQQIQLLQELKEKKKKLKSFHHVLDTPTQCWNWWRSCLASTPLQLPNFQGSHDIKRIQEQREEAQPNEGDKECLPNVYPLSRRIGFYRILTKTSCLWTTKFILGAQKGLIIENLNAKNRILV